MCITSKVKCKCTFALNVEKESLIRCRTVINIKIIAHVGGYQKVRPKILIFFLVESSSSFGVIFKNPSLV